MRRPIAPFLLVSLLLAGCGGNDAAVTVPDIDPALSAALAEPLLVDLDLVGQNRANSAADLPTRDGSLPTNDDNPVAIAAARAEALELVGGPGRMQSAPAAREGSANPAGVRANCLDRVQRTAQWAARMPGPFPVYPRGAVQEAAGTDASGCALRVVSFVTPVPLGDVMDFYFTRARDAGFSAQRVLDDGEDVLSGGNDRASFAVYGRRLPSGNTAVDLVTSG
jgi:hypothetical protein